MKNCLTIDTMRIFSLVCLIISVFQSVLPANIILIYISAIIGSSYCLYSYIYIIYICRNKFNPYLILSFSISFGYILSTLVYLFSNNIYDLKNINNIKYIFVNPDSYGYALSLVLFVSSFLGIVSTFSRSINMPSISYNISKRLIVFLNMSFFVSLLSFVLGFNGYRGTELSENGGLNPFSAFVLMMLPIQAVLYSFFSSKKKTYLIFLIIAIILISLSGRRNILYLFFIIPICMAMFGYSINVKWFLKKIHYILASIFVFIGLSYFFIALRVALNKGEEFSKLELISIGYYYIVNNSSDIFEYIQDTSEDRSFIISYLAVLIDKYNFQNLPLNGVEFYYAILNNIPSLFIDKSIIPDSMEDYTHPLYGIPIYDDANSILVSGFNDFYLVGAIFYPVFLAFSSVIFIKFINKIKDDFLKIVCVIFIIYNFVQVEVSMGALIGVYRSIAFFILFYFIFNFFYRILFSKSKK